MNTVQNSSISEINKKMSTNNSSNNIVSMNSINSGNNETQVKNSSASKMKLAHLEEQVETIINEFKDKMKNISSDILKKIDTMEKAIDGLDNLLVQMKNEKE